MKKVEFNELKEMNYDEGREMLLSAGYAGGEAGQTESNISEWAESEYFTLFDEEGNEVHKVSYAQYGNDTDEEDECQIVKEGWEEL